MQKSTLFRSVKGPGWRSRTLHLALLALLPAAVLEADFLREGDTVPQVVLLDENNQKVALAEPGRQTLVTFIFTRCAAMEFCPRMTRQFNEVQEKLKAAGAGDVRLLSISLDPEYDRPDMLKTYAEAVGADPTLWNFATGETAVIDSIVRDFRVHRNNEGGVLNHTLCTALIGPDGKISAIWRGNAWKPEEVVDAALKR